MPRVSGAMTLRPKRHGEMSCKAGIILFNRCVTQTKRSRILPGPGQWIAGSQQIRPFPANKMNSRHAGNEGICWHEKCFMISGFSPDQLADRPRPAVRQGEAKKKEVNMLETIIVILLVLWALGFFAFHVGGLVHVLLVIALVVVVLRLLQGKKIL